MSGWFKKSGRMTGKTARRITGISTPIGGVQWADPGPSQRRLARGFIVGLEDRRALFSTECTKYRLQYNVYDSINRVRSACTVALRLFDEDDFAIGPIRAIRVACRAFQDRSQAGFPSFHLPGDTYAYGPGFPVALAVLRGQIGEQVALLVAHYDLEVEGDLASVLPELPEDTP